MSEALKFHVYQDKSDEWRWRLKASNGLIIADSGQGYASKQSCLHGIDLIKNHSANSVVEEV